MDYYQIAGISMGVQWEKEEEKYKYYRYHDCIVLPRSMAAFQFEEMKGEPDIKVFMHTLCEYTDSQMYKQIYNQFFSQENNILVMMVKDPFDEGRPGYSLSMTRDYSYVEYTPHIKEYEHYDLQCMMHPFEGRVLYKGGIVLHGAAMEYKGKGFIFTGISGAGKTTQAHLWQKYRDALIINGDCPVIRMVNNTPIVSGTPWCGSSGEYVNKSVPLCAVILVKQGDRNTIKELRGNDALLALLSNVLRSNFDEKALDLSIANLTLIIGHIRIYELTCTISEEAVKLVENAII